MDMLFTDYKKAYLSPRIVDAEGRIPRDVDFALLFRNFNLLWCFGLRACSATITEDLDSY